MSVNKRIIEFVTQISNNHYIIISLDAAEIIGFEQIKEEMAILMFSNGKNYSVLGKHRNLINRWVYCLEKNSKSEIYHDIIIRPSIRFYNNNYDTIESDPIFLDSAQLKGFISVLRPELLKNKKILERLVY
jgi:hypothetical protein